MFKYIIVLVLFGSMAFAESAKNIMDSDFLLRVVHFIIFVVLLYFFVYKYVKIMFKNRTKRIAETFAKIQNELDDSDKKREEATAKVTEAKDFSKNLISSTKEDIKKVSVEMAREREEKISTLVKMYEERKKSYAYTYEVNLIKDVVDDLFTKNKIVEDDFIINTIIKKVS